MPGAKPAFVALLAALLVVGGCATADIAPSPAPASLAPSPSALAADWHDATLPVEARVDALLSQMTLDEKIGQMTQLQNQAATPADVTSLLLGSVLSGGNGAPVPNDPASWYAMVDAYQQAALATRLGIPILYGVDAVHGANGVVGATIFPHQVGLGAAGDPALVERIGRATAVEMAAVGVRWNFGPVVAVPQDVRWGRTYEGYGEDPAKVSELATAFIRGLQGDDLADPGAAAATPKHFAGDGGTGWGTSTTAGYSIDQGITVVDDATFQAIHLAPYGPAIEAGARIVMTSFSSTAAGKVTGDRHLLTEVLKGELGFTGFVVSDWGAIDQVDPDYLAAVATSISAGVDMAMVPDDARRFGDAVRAGLDSGAIEQGRVDDAVRRILRVKFELGLFEQPMPPEGEASVVGSEANRALAREAVARSQVLLATAPGVLPIDPAAGAVLLAGRGANDIGVQSGGWTITWQGSEGPTTPGTTIRDALAAELGDRLTVATDGVFAPDTHAPHRDRGACRAAVRGGARRLRHAGPAGRRPRGPGAGPAARGPTHRGGHLGPAGDARRDPAVCRRRHRGVAPGHGGRRRGRCPPRRHAVHGHDALHLAPDAVGRAANGEGRRATVRGTRRATASTRRGRRWAPRPVRRPDEASPPARASASARVGGQASPRALRISSIIAPSTGTDAALRVRDGLRRAQHEVPVGGDLVGRLRGQRGMRRLRARPSSRRASSRATSRSRTRCPSSSRSRG